MRIYRRELVLSAFFASSGCIGHQRDPTPTAKPDSDGDGIPDSADDYPADATRGSRTFRRKGTLTLQPGDFDAVAITNSNQSNSQVLHYKVATGGDIAVDCLLFERDAYDAYEEGNREVSVVSEYSRINVTETELTKQLDQGEYIFAVDYTALLTSPEAESVEVDLLVELADTP
jgi:hypothetical protein